MERPSTRIQSNTGLEDLASQAAAQPLPVQRAALFVALGARVSIAGLTAQGIPRNSAVRALKDGRDFLEKIHAHFASSGGTQTGNGVPKLGTGGVPKLGTAADQESIQHTPGARAVTTKKDSSKKKSKKNTLDFGQPLKVEKTKPEGMRFQDAFEFCWKNYLDLRRGDKGKARREWREQITSQSKLASLMERFPGWVAFWTSIQRSPDETRYQPSFANWLKGERWTAAAPRPARPVHDSLAPDRADTAHDRVQGIIRRSGWTCFQDSPGVSLKAARNRP